MSAINILSMDIYLKITEFIHNYEGLPIDCELQLKEEFKQVNSRTLSSILFTECNNRLKAMYYTYTMRSKELLRRFENSVSKLGESKVIMDMARESGIPPTMLSRILIFEKYKDLPKQKLLDIIRNPKLIPDRRLAENVILSTFTDNQEGPIIDIIRRCLGEEYETKLKEMATQVGMTYSDEGDLRRTGFDKTPDLKLTLPCLYKGMVVNWIESKALFGDVKTHRRYIHQQLASYSNRFGPGIVIYWFGFLEDIVNMKENGNNFIILNKFPEQEFLEFLRI